jgi:prephenate dehydrogenase
MTVGIVGLGLIGGSLAKAYRAADAVVYAFDKDKATLSFAHLDGTVDAVLCEDNISACDIVLVAIRPNAAVEYIRSMAPYIGAHPLVIDCCGVKQSVCEAVFPIAERYGFTFIGGHPMAGNHKSGYKNARANLFHNAPMVLVPPVRDDISLLTHAEELLAPAQFGRFSVTDAQEHDRMIAFTSQLAHIVSNAYIKSPTAENHKGFSAGSYKDLTRVAWLDPNMWAELFLENRDNVLFELDSISACLAQYRKAIAENDLAVLTALLDEGRRRKEEVDGR